MTGGITERLRSALDVPEAADAVSAYFREPVREGSGYTGRYFERFAGGGDGVDVCGRFTAADLLAVELLSVRVPAEVAIQMMHGELGDTLAGHLAAIPTDVSLGEPEAREQIVDGSPAVEAWNLLKDQTGVGYVTAGKLLARKRPSLIPIYDEVVRCVLGAPEHYWLSMHEVLGDEEVLRLIKRIRAEADVPEAVSVLRTVDVVLWMGHQADHRLGNC